MFLNAESGDHGRFLRIRASSFFRHWAFVISGILHLTRLALR
jgi:hypothetical protein